MIARRERGYITVAAAACIVVFALIAMTLVSSMQIATDDAVAEQATLRAGAAADAGFALVMARLLSPEAGERAFADGRTRTFHYRDAVIHVRVEDERGKIPLNGLTEDVATRLLEAAGVEGGRLLVARDSLLDWQDADDMPRPFGAERGDYADSGIRPANGDLDSIDELRLVRGFDTRTIANLRLLATVYVPPGRFDPRVARPEVLALMSGTGAKSAIAAIERARERARQRTAIAFSGPKDWRGRSLSIAVEAQVPDGRAVRRNVVQFTGDAAVPYVVIAAD
ncbi:general secretion pathway protein GspK [Sphingomonas sp. 8AM]|uniref:general secretion pathway protein GspK n=1 Tax=Sphingomonas sp. 8AM TaxID=2653170 RepID=UPI0012F0F537|nr:type II secretion system protein GspK [Sphingomonas sp. 8AM]VXD01476.1 Type II secretion system protein K [Sphingomonas sp. 8AM]